MRSFICENVKKQQLLGGKTQIEKACIKQFICKYEKTAA